MHIAPKQANENNREYAFRVVRENILNLEIQPGSMIGEQDIAQQLNMSRTPVHEALLELSKSKIVEILPQRGCRVSMIDLSLVEEARFIRKTMESAIVQMACDMATERDILELQDNVRLQEFYLATQSMDKIMELDDAFHSYMYKLCNKMQCYYMVQLMNVHFDRLRAMSLHSVKEIKIVDDHKALLEAIKNKDKAEALRLLEKHLSRLEVDKDAIKAQYPEYFVN